MRRKKGEPIDQLAQRLERLKRFMVNGDTLTYACRVCGVGRQTAIDYLYDADAPPPDEWWWAPDISNIEKHQRATVEECVRRNAKRSAARAPTDAWGYTARTPAALSRKYGSPPRITTLT